MAAVLTCQIAAAMPGGCGAFYCFLSLLGSAPDAALFVGLRLLISRYRLIYPHLVEDNEEGRV